MASVTFFGTYNTNNHPRVQVLIDGLRARKVQVIEYNVPLKLSTSERVSMLRQPWKLPLLGVKLARCWTKLFVLTRHAANSDAVIVGHLGHFDIHLARHRFRHQPIILDYMISGSDTARDRGVNGGIKLKLLSWLDNAALRAATIVLVDTEEHLRKLPKAYRSKGLVVAVGAPNSWFEYATDSKPNPGNRVKVIFFGSYTPLQGAPVIGEAISELHAEMEITMVGGGQDLEQTKLLSAKKQQSVEVNWLDWQVASSLPQLVSQHDICLGVFGVGPKALRVVPNKVYQGAAVGCAIITSDTPPQRRVLGEAAVYVPAGDAQALAAALDRLADNPKELMQLRSAAYQRAKTDFAPEKIVQPLVSRLWPTESS